MRGGGLDGLSEVLDAAAAVAQRETLTEAELLACLEDIYERLFLADFAHYDHEVVQRQAQPLIRHIFVVYLALTLRIDAWQRQGLMSRPVEGALRNVFRATRYARDILGEIALGHPRLEAGERPNSAFGGPDLYQLVNPKFGRGPVAFEPGDVLLQRGMVHNSAAISRIGDVDSQFSHLGIVARAPNGTLVMVEALIEEGSVVTPLETALGHGLGRAVLLRHQDRVLAERASDLILACVTQHNGQGKPTILYDFTMELGGYGELYCAKLVRLAYSMATDGELRLPTFATRLDMKNRDFIERIGVTAIETFAPGDMELEPGFDIVAEWRDYRVTSELRLKDMIMLKLFEWMEFHDYRFRPTAFARLVGAFGVLSARLPVAVQRLTSRFAGKVPPNMTARAVSAVAMLHWTAESFYKPLRRLEDESIGATGRPLHPRQIMEELERLRAARGRRIGYLKAKRRKTRT